MAYVSIGRIAPYPGFWLEGTTTAATVGGGSVLDASGEYHALCMIAEQDMVLTHIGWRSSNSSGSPSVYVRIETVGTDGVPTGTLWATTTEVAQAVITQAWQSSALTSPATIARGQTFAVVWKWINGSTNVARLVNAFVTLQSAPWEVTFLGGATTKQRPQGLPLISLQGSFTGFYQNQFIAPIMSFANNTFNNTNGARRGLRFRPSFGMRAVGMRHIQGANIGAYTIAIYDEAGTTELASNTFDAEHHSESASGTPIYAFFDVPVDLSANTWYRAVLIPTTATNCLLQVMTLAFSSTARASLPGNSDQHYTSYTTGGGWVDPVNNDIPMLDVLYDQIDVGGGGEGGGRAVQINNNSLVA